MRRRWTEKEIWDWYMSHEWISGFNLVPSTSLGGMLYVLQEYDHENAFRQTAKEIALAASLKLNSIRAGLPFYLWLKQRDIFFQKSGSVPGIAGFLRDDDDACSVQRLHRAEKPI